MSEPTAATWSELARWYDGLLQAGSGPHETALDTLLALVPCPVTGALLDVGCGQGLAARALCANGASSVVGVDAAQSMIDIARERTDPDAPITWRLDDAEHLGTCESASFDGAVCQLALMDIADFRAALGSIHRGSNRAAGLHS